MVTYSLHVICQIDGHPVYHKIFPQNKLNRSITAKKIKSSFLLYRNFISWQIYIFWKWSKNSYSIFNYSMRDHQKAIKHFNAYFISIKFKLGKLLHSNSSKFWASFQDAASNINLN